MNKIVRFAAVSLLTAAAALSTFAVSQVLKSNPGHQLVAGGNGPPPCNPLIEHCPSVNVGK